MSKKNSAYQRPTMAAIKRAAREVREKKVVRVETATGAKFEVAVDKYYRPSVAREIASDYLMVLFGLRQLLQEKKIVELDFMRMIEACVPLMVAKHITNIGIPNPEKVTEFLEYSSILVDLDILNLVLFEEDGYGEENYKKLKVELENIIEHARKSMSEEMLPLLLDEEDIDVDDYFATLEMRDFEITPDEDLLLYARVVAQLKRDGLYEEYWEEKHDDYARKKLAEREAIIEATEFYMNVGQEENEVEEE